MLLMLAMMLSCQPAGIAHHATHFDPRPALKAGDYEQVERYFAEEQRKFDRGEITGEELVADYVPLEDDYGIQWKRQLEAWVVRFPDSYSAHLARGINHVATGWLDRGSNFAADVPDRSMQRFADELVLAKQDLDASMRLDPRPYLSVLQLMKIARAMGDDAAEDAMLAYGDRVFPHDPRIHRAHFVSLEPRWGGSYEKMDAYRQTMRRGDREDRKFALQLDALEEQDKGNAQWNDNDEVAAQRHFAKALAIGARVGGCFATEYLGIALDFKKRGLPSPKPSVESSRRFHALGAELARSLDEHRYADAASLAEEYLKLAQENSLDPQHDIAVHDANAALGIVALDRGEGDKALGYLMKAVSAFDVSDRLAFPPSLELPNRLLARRYRSQVLMYLDTLSRVWRNDHGLYASWHARIQRGELPDLQAEAGQKSSR